MNTFFVPGVVQVLVAGNGKLANEILGNLSADYIASVLPWKDRPAVPAGNTVAVHAGSGRELPEVISFCTNTGSVLIDLATTSDYEGQRFTFPLVVCPNTNILMLKFMRMLKDHGHSFAGYERSILESHQSSKTSTPGTALNLAQSIGLPGDRVVSIRDPELQHHELGIPGENLARHAFHRIEIKDENVSLRFETKVLGESSYSRGLGSIIEGLTGKTLECRLYNVLELVELGRL